MKEVNFNTPKNNITYGLSCVENYLLRIFQLEGLDYNYLFYEANLCFSKILHAFVFEKAKYAYFDKVNRIQSLASNCGVIEMCLSHSFNEVFINNCDYILVMVDKNYISSKYNMELLRPDHYIMLSPLNKDEYCYYNDPPYDTGIIKKNELLSAFGGRIIGINIKSKISNQFKLQSIKSLLKTFSFDDIELSAVENIVAIRDSFGILKILRNRLYAFCSGVIDTKYWGTYIGDLDRAYMRCEYLRLKPRGENLALIMKLVEEINLKDKEILIKTKKEMEKLMKEKVISIISQFSFVNEGDITLDDKLIDLGIDSLKIVELILSLEEQFGFVFDDEILDLENLKDVQSVIQLVERN